jgi:hypothetical protein
LGELFAPARSHIGAKHRTNYGANMGQQAVIVHLSQLVRKPASDYPDLPIPYRTRTSASSANSPAPMSPRDTELKLPDRNVAKELAHRLVGYCGRSWATSLIEERPTPFLKSRRVAVYI